MFDSLLERGGLSLDRLRNFLLVADAGSISKAAGGDPNRQSLMSRQIRELEEFFGTDLTALPLALPTGGGSFHRVLASYFESAEIPWRPAVESTSFLQALALVEGGEFAAILPSIGASRLPENRFTLKPIADLRSANRKLVLHWNRRQMQTRDVSDKSIRKLRDAIRGSG